MPTINCKGMNTGALSRWGAVLLLLFCMSGSFFAQPANDNPCGSIPLPVNVACAATAGTRNNANATNFTPAVPAPGCANYTGADVWFTVVVPANGAVSIQTTAGAGGGGLNNGGMAAYYSTGCANGSTFTLIECDDDSGPGSMPQLDLTCQTPGATIYIRFWREGGSGNTFTICAVTLTPPPVPANDGPCGATILPPNASCVNTASTTVGACNTTVPGNPTCGTTAADVWFRVTTVAFGRLGIQSTAGTLTNGVMAIYSATACGGTFTELLCVDDVGANLMPSGSLCLAAGTYYVRFWGSGGSTGTFSICATYTAASVPANDGPCGATVLPPNASCVNTASSNLCATNTVAPGNPSCGTTSSDVWFRVTTVSYGTLVLQTTAGTVTNGVMAVYSATACGGVFTQLSCTDDVGANLMPSVTLTCRPAGTYYVRFWGSAGSTGTFSICATFSATTTPPNDDPCSATVLPPNPTCVNTAGSNSCATNTTTPGNPSCVNSSSDVWYTVTTTTYGTLVLQSTAGTLTDGVMAIYSATACGGTFTQLACVDNVGGNNMPSRTITCLAAGTYYVRFWGAGGSTGTFSICATFTATTPPPNDTPCTATALTVNTTCVTTAGDNTCATNTTGPPAPGCGSYTGNSRDLWYSFVAPTNGIGIIESTAGTLTEGAMALYSGTCGSLTLVECDDDDGAGNMPFLKRFGLVAGNTYFIRYWGFGNAVGTFTICVKSPTNPVGFSCSHLLELFDTGWDGWGTSSVTVTINGGSPTVYTCATGYEAILIGLNIGQVVAYTYSNTGANQNQNEYQVSLFPSLALYFNSGTPPGNGLGYTKTVTCNPPSVLQEDCLGAKTICGGAVSSYNPPNTGNNVDLNSGNYGCLSAAERQGTWYIYRVSSGGNLGMTVDPSGNDDYDWGIWGPYPSGSTTGSVCIPSGPPVRCTWASGGSTFSATGSYNTGMGHATYSPPQWAPSGTPSTENSGGDGWVSGMAVVTGEIYILYVSNYSQSGLSFTLSWQFNSGASLDCTVLPVELLTLGATAEGSSVSVDWATASETNSDYYVVERSSDAEHFRPIGTVEAAGESQHRIEYSFTDLFPQDGANYYRLKQVDLDGAYERTEKVVVLFGKQDKKPTLFPNPTQDVLNISFEMPLSGTAYVQVLDASGRVVRDRDVDVERGQQTISIGTGGLSAGPHEMRLFTNSTGIPQNAQFIKE